MINYPLYDMWYCTPGVEKTFTKMDGDGHKKRAQSFEKTIVLCKTVKKIKGKILRRLLLVLLQHGLNLLMKLSDDFCR